jgi:hypothetical protein
MKKKKYCLEAFKISFFIEFKMKISSISFTYNVKIHLNIWLFFFFLSFFEPFDFLGCWDLGGNRMYANP